MSETDIPGLSESSRILRYAGIKNYDKLEEAWLDAIDDASVETAEFIGALEILVKRSDNELAETLFWMLLESRIENDQKEEALALVVAASPYLPDSDMLRGEISKLYEEVRIDFPRIENLIKLTVTNKDIPLMRGVDSLERYLHLPPGAFVLNKETLKPGRVLGGDEENRGLEVEFEAGCEVFDTSALEQLEPLPDDDFRARTVFDSESLKEISGETPEELLAMALKAFGGRMDYTTLKVKLRTVVPPASWARWWIKAKKPLKRSTRIEMTPGSQPTLILRKAETTYSNRVRDQFTSARSHEQGLAIVLEYMDEGRQGHHEIDIELIRYFAEVLGTFAENPGGDTGEEALCATAVISEMASNCPEAQIQTISIKHYLKPESLRGETLLAIRNDRIALAVLDAVQRELGEEWLIIFAEFMPGSSAKACERICTDLVKAEKNELVNKAAGEIMRRPVKFSLALTWLWKSFASPRFKAALANIEGALLAARLLSAANSLGRTPDITEAQQDQLAQIRNAVAAKNFSTMGKVLEDISSADARQIKDAAMRNVGLSETSRIHLVDMIMEAHPGLFADNLPPWEEDLIYTTRAGLEKFEKEYQELINVKISENAKAIGEAASHGDLSENSEWTAALEVRDRLTEKAGRMREDMNKIKIIPPDMVVSATIAIGTRAHVKNLDSDQLQVFTFLGPWESDPEAGVFSYRAPLSQSFMGKGVGETVTWGNSDNEHRYEILKVEPGI